MTMRWHCWAISSKKTIQNVMTLWWHYDDTMMTLRWHYDDTMTTLWWHYDDTMMTLLNMFWNSICVISDFCNRDCSWELFFSWFAVVALCASYQDMAPSCMPQTRCQTKHQPAEHVFVNKWCKLHDSVGRHFTKCRYRPYESISCLDSRVPFGWDMTAFQEIVGESCKYCGRMTTSLSIRYGRIGMI